MNFTLPADKIVLLNSETSKNVFTITIVDKKGMKNFNGRAISTLRTMHTALKSKAQITFDKELNSDISTIANAIYSRYESRYNDSWWQSILDTFTRCFGGEIQLEKVQRIRDKILILAKVPLQNELNKSSSDELSSSGKSCESGESCESSDLCPQNVQKMLDNEEVRAFNRESSTLEAIENTRAYNLLDFVKSLPNELKNNEKVALACVKKSSSISLPEVIQLFSERLRTDEKIALQIVQKNGVCLKHLPQMQDNEIVVVAAIENVSKVHTKDVIACISKRLLVKLESKIKQCSNTPTNPGHQKSNSYSPNPQQPFPSFFNQQPFPNFQQQPFQNFNSQPFSNFFNQQPFTNFQQQPFQGFFNQPFTSFNQQQSFPNFFYQENPFTGFPGFYQQQSNANFNYQSYQQESEPVQIKSPWVCPKELEDDNIDNNLQIKRILKENHDCGINLIGIEGLNLENFEAKVFLKNIAKKTLCKMLDIDFLASDDEIKKKYKKVVLKVHPDKNVDNKFAKEAFQCLNAAFTLKDLE
ncbi:MAG: DnaJ domain-containing protein [Parachlamydiaceae bacterium]|nr:DnaJ domain-containing protein [Parachlamydiaceae bacterium]